MISGMAEFKLSKWYLDCVGESGDASIIYAGAARWGPVRLRYSSLLESAAGAVSTRYSLRAGEPTLAAGALRWSSVPLRADGEWLADSTEIRETLFASEAGRIEWRCLMPRARARIGNLAGLGYAERLEMTVAPWKLPLRTLRWGRFASAADWLVWIAWGGEFPRAWVYRNGREVRASSIEDDGIELDDGARLILDRSLVLRQGPLGSTALSAIPGIRETVPLRLLQVDECKWRSRARLERTGEPPVEGWAIHERVEWPA